MQHRMAVRAHGSQVLRGVDDRTGGDARDRVYMVYFDESFADRSIDRRKIKATHFATDSVNFNARGAIDVTALVLGDNDLLPASLGLPRGFCQHRLQWHQGKNSTEQPAAPGQGQ